MYAKCYTYHSTDLEIFKSEYKTEFYRVIDKICTKERSIITTSGWSPLGIVGKLRIALDKDNFFRIAHKKKGGGGHHPSISSCFCGKGENQYLTVMKIVK